MLFDLIKSFDYIESSHKSDIYSKKKKSYVRNMLYVTIWKKYHGPDKD